MSYAKQMLDTHPRRIELDTGQLAGAIAALYECAQACTACADACLSEDQVADQIRCIRLNQDCADVCETTGRVLTRQTELDPALTRALLEACIQACRTCAQECEHHAEMGMEHCRVCAEACRRCEEACAGLLDSIHIRV